MLDEPFLILQDDAVPLPGFMAAADQARELVPNALISFAVPGSLNYIVRSRFWRALDEHPATLLQYRPVNWVSTIALAWTPDLAAKALYWDATQRTLRPNFTGDDGRIFYFARQAKVDTWLTAPCIVDHPDDTPSVMEGGSGTGKAKRRALALLAGDAATVQWRTCALV